MSEKKYFILLANPLAEGPTADLINGHDVDIYDGEPIGAVDEEFEFILNIAGFADPKKIPPTDIVESDHQILFLRKLINLLASLGIDNIEYFPTKSIYAPTGEACDYMVANVIGVVSGLDLGKSICKYDEDGFMYGVDKIVFDESKYSNYKIFRLKEKIMLTVIHKDIKNEIEKEGLTGVMMIEDTMWQPGMI